MFGIEELKENIEITNTTVECPVKDCVEKVEKQQRNDIKTEKRFLCQIHNIYITPTTFLYKNELDNILWDYELLYKIKEVKRESRFFHDNSEDAVTWNIIRFLEKNNLVNSILGSILKIPIQSPEIIYWSYSQKEKDSWSMLNEARTEFGERIRRSSEPDIIIKTDSALLFIEAKLTSGNNTSSRSNPKKYLTGGKNWFQNVFTSNYDTIVRLEKKYELMRFWLLGTWIADQHNLDFYLINLVLSEQEKDIEEIFNRLIRTNENRKFIRITWEDIYLEILNNELPGSDKEKMINYFQNKTIGYKYGRIRRAFSIPK